MKIMLIKIVPHSTIQHLLSKQEENYEADLVKYEDIFHYIEHMHPRLNKWHRTIELNDEQSPVCILNKEGEMILPDQFNKTITDPDEVLYIVPIVCGGGGKIGKVIAGVALIAAVVYTGGLAWTATGGFVFSGIGSKILFNVGLALISSAFMKEPEQPEQAETLDQAVRQSNQFGSLRATEGQGTYLAIAYGQVRVVGHMLSGYIEPHKHGTGDTLVLSDIYDIPKNNTTKNSGVV